MFIHSCNEQLGCFQLLAIVNCAAMNIEYYQSIFQLTAAFCHYANSHPVVLKMHLLSCGDQQENWHCDVLMLDIFKSSIGICSRERNQCDGASGNQVLGRRNDAKLSQQPRESRLEETVEAVYAFFPPCRSNLS